jgi:hypothetical protein
MDIFYVKNNVLIINQLIRKIDQSSHMFFYKK